MNDSFVVARHCLRDFAAVKKELCARHSHSDFEMDYELRLALFLTAFIDGAPRIDEKNFIQHASRFLDWSSTYESLLLSKIEKQPGYDLDQLRIARQHPSLGRILFKASLGLAWSDGHVTQEERFFLENLGNAILEKPSTEIQELLEEIIEQYGLSGGSGRKPGSPHVPSSHSSSTSASNAGAEEEEIDIEAELAKLNDLIGLNSVKSEINKLVRYLEIQAKRREHDLAETSLSLHMVFTGNPGTGKTTVARILARIFKALKILKKGHLVETDRMAFIGQYIGHTAKKTSDVIDGALDGVLFIDEAYSLASDSENDFGQEAVDTLVKRMEDHRSRLIVIAAGYPNEMKRFINSNPGLKSRFGNTIAFENYSVEELLAIFNIFCDRNDYKLTEPAKEKIKTIFRKELDSTAEDFGNGRFARNFFEKALRNQALRLSAQKAPLTKDDLMYLTEHEIIGPGNTS